MMNTYMAVSVTRYKDPAHSMFDYGHIFISVENVNLTTSFQSSAEEAERELKKLEEKLGQKAEEYIGETFTTKEVRGFLD